MKFTKFVFTLCLVMLATLAVAASPSRNPTRMI